MPEPMIVRADAAIVRNIPAARQELRTMNARADSSGQRRSFSGHPHIHRRAEQCQPHVIRRKFGAVAGSKNSS
jgi:hypothetical protein